MLGFVFNDAEKLNRLCRLDYKNKQWATIREYINEFNRLVREVHERGLNSNTRVIDLYANSETEDVLIEIINGTEILMREIDE